MAIYMYNSRTMNQDYLDRYNILFQLFLKLDITMASLDVKLQSKELSDFSILNIRLQHIYRKFSWKLRTPTVTNMLLALLHGGKPNNLRKILL